jgi:ubiquinone/menaquinone biosynthesis C-methylase UbiE
VADRYVPAAGRSFLTPVYDAVNAVTMRQGAWRPVLVDRAFGSGAPRRILDLGCGTGQMALEILRRYPNVELIGVDGDPDVLRRARSRADSAGLRLGLHEARAERLPLGDASVDCVISTLLFHHLAPAGKREALAEARRVLVPGGRLLICDPGRPQDPLMHAAFFLVRLLDGFPNTRDHAAGRFPDIVREAGFSDVAVVGRYRTGGGTLEVVEGFAP